jgi:hypothetical protein
MRRRKAQRKGLPSSSQRASLLVSRLLNQSITCLPIAEAPIDSASASFDVVVLGNAIYQQNWLPEMTRFLFDHVNSTESMPETTSNRSTRSVFTIYPGPTQFTLVPAVAYSTSNDDARCLTAVFDALYGDCSWGTLTIIFPDTLPNEYHTSDNFPFYEMSCHFSRKEISPIYVHTTHFPQLVRRVADAGYVLSKAGGSDQTVDLAVLADDARDHAAG